MDFSYYFKREEKVNQFTPIVLVDKKERDYKNKTSYIARHKLLKCKSLHFVIPINRYCKGQSKLQVK